MRTIGFLLLLGVIPGLSSANLTLADELENQNKNAKIEFQADNLKIVPLGGIPQSGKNSIPYNYPGYEPVKTDREIILERRAGKLRVYSLPKGKFTANVSAYTAAADECGKSDGITASGVRVQDKRTLACPPQYPFGAKVRFDGYGTYVCEDRGGAIKGNHFDVYVETKPQAFAFGRRNLTAEFVK